MSLFTGESEPGRPYWWEGMDWPQCNDEVPSRVDLLVIGGGYTGLSAAIAGHDAGARVAVVDAGRPGHGASTRNCGMVGAHPRLSWSALARSFGDATADAIFAEAAPALSWLVEFIDREGIGCDLRRCGRVQLAYTAEHFANQGMLASDIRSRSVVRCEVLDKVELSREIVTPLYVGGLMFPEHCGFDPARFHCGLLAAVLGRGVAVIERAPVLEVLPEAGGFRVRTQRGMVRADKVLMATNGYLRGRFGWYRRRVFPVPSYMIATEPLSEEVIQSIAPGGRMMVETRSFHSYFRVSPDGTRILFGGRASMVRIGFLEAAIRLRRVLGSIWPSLRDVRISHVWTGNTGFSFGQVPHVGQRRGMDHAMGYSGSGTVLAPYLGSKAVLGLLGKDGRTAYGSTELKSRWFYTGGEPYFLRLADICYRGLDVCEDRASRSGRGSIRIDLDES